MTSGEFQYIEDSFLIEKIAILERSFIKEASITDIFSGVSDAVGSFVQSHLDTSSTGSTIKSVLKMLEPALFFRAHWILGILSSIASEFGFSITDAVSSIVSKIAPKLLAGESITPEEVNQAGLSLGGDHTISASFLHELHELEKTGSLIKSAVSSSGTQQPLGGSFFGQKGAPLLYRLFGFLGQKKKGAGKSVLIGFVVWFIKTILLSAGLLSVSGAAKKLVTNDDGNDKKPSENKTQTVSNNTEYREQSEEDWYVPVVNHSIESTLADWAREFYPEVSQYEDILLNNIAFQNMVELISQHYEQGKDVVYIPPQFTTRQSIVSKFIPSVKSDIRKTPQMA